MTAAEREIKAMLGIMEQRGQALMAQCADPRIRRDNVASYRQFVEDVESFLMFINIVDERLQEHKVVRRRELQLYCSSLRWQTYVNKLNIIERYVDALTEDGRPLVLGVKNFYEEELRDLDTMESYHRRFSQAHQLASYDAAKLAHCRDKLQYLARETIDFEEFDPAEARRAERESALARRREFEERRLAAAMSGSSGGMSDGSRPGSLRPAPALPPSSQASAATPLGPGRAMPAGAVQLPVVVRWGKSFLAAGAQEVVTEACRIHRISTEMLARSLGVSTLTLAMVLRGQDPISSNSLRSLESFVAGNGLPMAPMTGDVAGNSS